MKVGREHIFSYCNDRLIIKFPLPALWYLSCLVCMWLVLLILSLLIGSHHLTPQQVWLTLHHNLTTLPTNTDPSIADKVIWNLRFPRALAASLTGIMLALSGATLQNVTRNPLADPSLVGVSQGAGLAVVALIVAFPEVHYAWRPFIAFLGAILVAILIQSISYHRQGNNTMRFILTGIGIAAFISAITNAMLTYGNLDRATSALGWLAGNIQASRWIEVAYLTFTSLIIFPLILLLSRAMSVIRLGDELAINLGVQVTQIRFSLVILSVTLAAVAVAAVGPITFVGLIAPHIARRITYAGTGLHLILTAIIGAILVCLADLLGRNLFSPQEIPAGLFTAIIGVPIFIILILRTKNKITL